MANRRRDVVTEFADYFGEETKLENWQKLCALLDLGSKEDLSSMNKCKEALKTVWVNIYDLLDAVNANTKPQKFASHSALRNYTMRKGEDGFKKIFPLKKAKEGGPVRALLVHIHGRGR